MTSDAVHGKQFLILARDGVFGFCQYPAQGVTVERHCRWVRIGQTTDNLGYESERFAGPAAATYLSMSSLLTRLRVESVEKPTTWVFMRWAIFCLDAVECSAAHKEDVFGVDRNHALLGMLAAALGRDVDNRAFEEFQQTLLDALAADVARDARGCPPLRAILSISSMKTMPRSRSSDVVVGGLEQSCEEALDVLADITGLGEDGGVDDGEGHVKRSGRMVRGEKGLARAGRTDEDDVALLDVDARRPRAD